MFPRGFLIHIWLNNTVKVCFGEVCSVGRVLILFFCFHILCNVCVYVNGIRYLFWYFIHYRNIVLFTRIYFFYRTKQENDSCFLQMVCSMCAVLAALHPILHIKSPRFSLFLSKACVQSQPPLVYIHFSWATLNLCGCKTTRATCCSASQDFLYWRFTTWVFEYVIAVSLS